MTTTPISPATLGVVVLGGMLGVAVRAAIVPSMGDDFEVAVVATMIVNIVGSGLLGVVVGRLDDRRPLVRAFLGTGVLGGFTTYSAFALQTVVVGTAIRIDGPPEPPAVLLGLGLAALTVIGGLLAAATGVWVGRRLADVPGEIEPPEDAR
ncbi:fluoride efflux transporter FluC [Microbacterium fluvii]|uniref:Fluoride-specific ion channel FluC n=1 Tax=Microbacterium fluvii TaxID=415215 RepID=A0ABW2HIC0_9MICO|nr:CrcB family protein [Microbacterium fluvii]MCU4673891.1 CrcB family protein [Microbacterium fluvii]